MHVLYKEDLLNSRWSAHGKRRVTKAILGLHGAVKKRTESITVNMLAPVPVLSYCILPQRRQIGKEGEGGQQKRTSY